MSKGDEYVKLVEWSDEDACFTGSCPELFYGGCHGSDSPAVFSELCDMVESSIEVHEREGRTLLEPLSGRDVVSALQRIA